jgi:hypothetical protein
MAYVATTIHALTGPSDGTDSSIQPDPGHVPGFSIWYEWTIFNVFSTPYPEILPGVGEYKTLGK